MRDVKMAKNSRVPMRYFASRAVAGPSSSQMASAEPRVKVERLSLLTVYKRSLHVV
jgi:hypothetical protein